MAESRYTSFDQLSEAVTSQLYELTANIKTVQKYISKLPEKATSGKTNVEQEFSDLSQEVTENFKKGGELIKSLQDWDPRQLSNTQQFSQESLAKEYTSMLQQYRNLQREAAEKERKLMQQAQTNLAAQGELNNPQVSETTPLMAHQQQQLKLDVVNQEEVDFLGSVVHDRETEIQDIERNITEVNAIFRDVGTLVNEQAPLLDTVEENVSNLAINTRNASRQLDQADAYQRKRRKWSCLLLTFLLVIVLIIVLALVA
jgi:t-SNARE complex subunit (syntaxin)